MRNRKPSSVIVLKWRNRKSGEVLAYERVTGGARNGGNDCWNLIGLNPSTLQPSGGQPFVSGLTQAQFESRIADVINGPNCEVL